MPRRDPAAVARKWSERGQASQQAIIDGVRGVTTAPGESAVAHQDALRQRFLQAVDSGKWAENTRGVSLAEWQRSMTEVGAPHAVEGFRRAMPNVQSFMTEFLPYAERVSSEVRAMPNGTDGEREQRALATIRAMRQFRRTRRV